MNKKQKKKKKKRLKKFVVPALTNKPEDIIKKQQKLIEELMERVGRLEGNVSAMQGELAVVRNIAKHSCLASTR